MDSQRVGVFNWSENFYFTAGGPAIYDDAFLNDAFMRGPDNRYPGSQGQDNRYPGSQSPGDRYPGSQGPTDRYPGSQSPGDRYSGSRPDYSTFGTD